jgi:hypothetical protein
VALYGDALDVFPIAPVKSFEHAPSGSSLKRGKSLNAGNAVRALLASELQSRHIFSTFYLSLSLSQPTVLSLNLT